MTTRRDLLRAVALGLPAALAGCGQSVRRLPDASLTLRGGFGQGPLLARVARELAAARQALAAEFGPPPTADLEVRLVHDFSSPAGVGAIARYLPRQRAIELVLGNGPDPLGDPTELRGCLWHEYAHVVLHDRAAGEALPAWLDEGAAELYGKYRSGIAWSPEARGGEFLRWVAGGRVPRLTEVNRLFFATDHARAYTAYAFAYSAVALMIERFGPDAPARCIDAIGERYSVGGALKRLYGARLADFEADWQAILLARYGRRP